MFLISGLKDSKIIHLIKKNIFFLFLSCLFLLRIDTAFSQHISEITDLTLECTLDNNNILYFKQSENLNPEKQVLLLRDKLLEELIQEAVNKQKTHHVYDQQYAINPQILYLKISKDLEKYYYFPEYNSAYQKKISSKKLLSIIKKSKHKADMIKKPQRISPQNLAKLILDKLNIQHLVKILDQQCFNVTCTKIIDNPGYVEKNLIFDNSVTGRFQAIVLIPKKQAEKYPAIIGLHGHGQSAEKFQRDFSIEKLAEQGFVVIIPSFRAMELTAMEYIISKKLLLSGFNLIGIRVYETLLTISYLKSMDIVDPQRIGILAHSGGSNIAALVKIISSSIKVLVLDHQSSFIDFTDLYGISDDIVPGLAEYAKIIHEYTDNLNQLNVVYGQINPEQGILSFFEKYLQQ